MRRVKLCVQGVLLLLFRVFFLVAAVAVAAVVYVGYFFFCPTFFLCIFPVDVYSHHHKLWLLYLNVCLYEVMNFWWNDIHGRFNRNEKNKTRLYDDNGTSHSHIYTCSYCHTLHLYSLITTHIYTVPIGHIVANFYFRQIWAIHSIFHNNDFVRSSFFFVCECVDILYRLVCGVFVVFTCIQPPTCVRN